MIKKIFAIILMLGCLFIFAGCDYEPVERPEQPHLYWKDIEVVVEDVVQKHWFATVHRYELSITVYSEEYNLRKTFNSYTSGMVTPNGWNSQEGDVITAELYSWVMDSTGEVVRREINRLK